MDIVAVAAGHRHLRAAVACIADIQMRKGIPVLQIDIQLDPNAIYIGSRVSGLRTEGAGQKSCGRRKQNGLFLDFLN